MKALNKHIQQQIENATRGLRFAKLNKESLQLLVFTDAFFANNKDLLLQIGSVLVLADSKNANIIYQCFIKCKRVIRSVLALELYRITYRFDIVATVKSTINLVLNIDLLLILCIDSKLLYKYLVKLGIMQEK